MNYSKPVEKENSKSTNGIEVIKSLDIPAKTINKSALNYNNKNVLWTLNGQQKKWYATGEIFKILNLEMGKEEGIQQAFRKNGFLYANYEARAGRIFGLKKAALCYGWEHEDIQY